MSAAVSRASPSLMNMPMVTDQDADVAIHFDGDDLDDDDAEMIQSDV